MTRASAEDVVVHEQLIRENDAAWGDYREASLAAAPPAERQGLYACARRTLDRLTEFEARPKAAA